MEPSILDKWDALHTRVRRWRWWIRLAAAVIVLPPLGRFAHTRMTTPPADPNALATLFAPPSPDPAADLITAIGRIPPAPPLPAPPAAPSGKHWEPTKEAKSATLPLSSIDVDEARQGPWTPETRHHLRAIIDYLETPALQAALDEVAKQTVLTVLPADYWNMSLSSQIRGQAKILCAKACYHLMQRHDAAAAGEDLRRVLALAAMLEREGSLIRHLVAIACRSLVYDRVIRWSREVSLTRDQQQELQAALRSHPVDLAASWRGANQGECLFARRMLDAAYTKGPDGNGWFVPHAPVAGDLADKTESLMNLLSPMVNDRLTVTRKIEFAMDRSNRAIDLPFLQAMDLLGKGGDGKQLGQASSIGNPVDWAAGSGEDSRWQLYRGFVRNALYESAAVTSLALSAYKTEHGRYPARLSNLVPEYLPTLPIDVAGQPLCYRLDDRDGYSLYSPGNDGVDNGGLLRNAEGRPFAWGGPDWLFPSLDQEEDGVEWYLVADDTEQPSATTQPE